MYLNTVYKNSKCIWIQYLNTMYLNTAKLWVHSPWLHVYWYTTLNGWPVLLQTLKGNKPDQAFNVVYQYTCNQGECTTSQSTYIGYTRTTIKDRFKQHAAIKKHHKQKSHNSNITGFQMLPNVIILATEHNKQDLAILEAFLIKQHGPKFNRQTEYFNNTLKNF